MKIKIKGRECETPVYFRVVYEDYVRYVACTDKGVIEFSLDDDGACQFSLKPLNELNIKNTNIDLSCQIDRAVFAQGYSRLIRQMAVSVESL